MSSVLLSLSLSMFAVAQALTSPMHDCIEDLYGQAKHKVSILVHTAKCKFYTEIIALASSSKELYQIVNTLSNRHPNKILPKI